MKKFLPQFDGHRVYNDDFKVISDSIYETNSDILKSFIRSINKPVRLYGLEKNQVQQNVNISGGAIFYYDEIYRVEGLITPVNVADLNKLYLKVVETDIPDIDPIEYADSSMRTGIHVDRTLDWARMVDEYQAETPTGFYFRSLVEMDLTDKYTIEDFCPPAADIEKYFDSTGLGINLKEGWAICNGQNGTPDLRGYFTVMASNNMGQNLLLINAINNVNYKTRIGSKSASTTIQKHNLPNYNLDITQQPHSHTFNYDVELLDAATSVLKYGVRLTGLGNNQYPTLWTTENAIEEETIDITVNTAGGGMPLITSTIPPAYAVIKIMKIR